MKIEDIKINQIVENKKYKVLARIQSIIKMKDSKKGWIKAVLYMELDRNETLAVPTLFAKDIYDFINEFEIIN